MGITNELHRAVESNDREYVQKILEDRNNNGIDIHAEDKGHKTALILACVQGNQHMVELLLNAGCSAQPKTGFKHSPLRGACIYGHDHLIPLLLRHGADPNALSEGDRTPLMGCVYLRDGVEDSQSIKCVKALLADERTDPTRRNTFGESALDLAYIRGYNESAEFIKSALVRWNEKNHNQP